MPATLVPIPSGYEGRYTTAASYGIFRNTVNKAVDADLDGDDAEDAGAVEQAITAGEAKVDLYTSGPFTFSDDDNGEIAADTFETWANAMTAMRFVAKRLPKDADPPWWYTESLREMRDFRDGKMSLPGAVPANTAEVAAEGNPGVFEFVDIDRGQCTADEYAQD